MNDLTNGLTPSAAVFPRGYAGGCLFCGSGAPWFGEHGCGGEWARRRREGKLDFQMISRNGKLVVTKCSQDLRVHLIGMGWGRLASVTDKSAAVTDNETLV